MRVSGSEAMNMRRDGERNEADGNAADARGMRNAWRMSDEHTEME